MTGCTNCGQPVEEPEEHHHNHQKGDNDPDNLRLLCRRCHMQHHGNDRAVDDQSQQTYGPRSPATGPPGPS